LRRQKIYKDANVCDGRGGLLDRHEMESGESKNKKMILGGVEILLEKKNKNKNKKNFFFF